MCPTIRRSRKRLNIANLTDFPLTGHRGIIETMGPKYLVDHLETSGVLKSPQLINAFHAIDRADFVLPTDRPQAYNDETLPIGFGQTISQPSTVAFMLELLQPQSGQVILDIGSGSGYQAALLTKVVASNEFGQELPATASRGKVISLEFIPELAQLARKNLARYNFIKTGVLEVHCLNAAKGYVKEAPYDAIISAASGETVPSAWKEQLKVGGRMVLPIDHTIILLVKKSESEFEEHRFEGFSFVPFVPDVEPDE